MSLIKCSAAGNKLSQRYIASPESLEAESEESIEVQIAKKGAFYSKQKKLNYNQKVCGSVLLFHFFSWIDVKMVHAINGRKYSVQPDGCGQGSCQGESMI